MVRFDRGAEVFCPFSYGAGVENCFEPEAQKYNSGWQGRVEFFCCADVGKDFFLSWIQARNQSSLYHTENGLKNEGRTAVQKVQAHTQYIRIICTRCQDVLKINIFISVKIVDEFAIRMVG